MCRPGKDSASDVWRHPTGLARHDEIGRSPLVARYRRLICLRRSPEIELTQGLLSPCEMKAFNAMSRSEQQHSLRVLKRVLARDPGAPRALTAAALLHDVGKSRYQLSVWQKTLAVVVEAIAPAMAHKLSHADSINRWRAPSSSGGFTRSGWRDSAPLPLGRGCDLAGGTAPGSP